MLTGVENTGNELSGSVLYSLSAFLGTLAVEWDI